MILEFLGILMFTQKGERKKGKDALLNAKFLMVFDEVEDAYLTQADFFQVLTHAFQIESMEGAVIEYGMQKTEGARYSFLCFDPIARFTVNGNDIEQEIEGEITSLKGDPFVLLRQWVAHHACVPPEGIHHFTTGALGFVTYDAVRFFEKIPDRHPKDQYLPEMAFQIYRSAVGFDHQTKKWKLSQLVRFGENSKEAILTAKAVLKERVSRICAEKEKACFTPAPFSTRKAPSMIETDLSDVEFMHKVEEAKTYIQRGEAFQIVLSRCWKRKYSKHPLCLYAALRNISPSPYLFYLPLKDRVVIGASPERLVSVQDGRVTINPIAGTRRRTPEQALDAIKADLLSDEKELAEHRMLVDLARNDIGAVCKPGTIKVREYAQVKHFSHVSHIASVVEGEIKQEKDALDALSYAFPAGTLSGAPKIRAMELIDTLENTRRGLYGGAIVHCDFQGNLESCIAIRMSVLKDGVATVRTGAGIVHDSQPVLEARETRQKASAMLEAIAVAEGEIL